MGREGGGGGGMRAKKLKFNFNFSFHGSSVKLPDRISFILIDGSLTIKLNSLENYNSPPPPPKKNCLLLILYFWN